MIIIVPLFILMAVIAWALQPGKKPTAPRRNAILLTTIPALVLAAAAVIVQLWHKAAGTVEVSDISNTLFVVGLGLIAACIIAAIVSLVIHKTDIAKGLGFGICIAVVISIIELGLLEWLSGV